jgi:Polyphosphate kinase
MSDSGNALIVKPDQLFNRELSWIAFNHRVLQEGMDDRTPLLERVKFFSIFTNNLDEFFMVRVAGVKRRINSGELTPSDDGLTPREQLLAIYQALVPLVRKQHEFFQEQLRPKLAQAGIHICDYTSSTTVNSNICTVTSKRKCLLC